MRKSNHTGHFPHDDFFRMDYKEEHIFRAYKVHYYYNETFKCMVRRVENHD